MPETILVIDDDPNLRSLMHLALTTAGYTAVTAHDGAEGLRSLEEYHPDLVLLDVMMPDLDGWEVCQRIRTFSGVPIIFLTALQAEQDKAKGLDLGADDYIVKPFHQAELRARVKAALRRAHMPPLPAKPTLRYGDGDLVINTAACTVMVRGREVGLTPTEYRLLVCLAEQLDHSLTLEQLARAVWYIETNATPANINWYIWRLRGKIERDPAQPRFILTEPGVGYRFAG
jgi:DNA-binding response OmpR family regulator